VNAGFLDRVDVGAQRSLGTYGARLACANDGCSVCLATFTPERQARILAKLTAGRNAARDAVIDAALEGGGR
jgi:hypothetical protein